MRLTRLAVAASALFAATALSAAMAADVAKPAAPPAAKADSILGQMSDTLSKARQFSFRGTREVSVALAQAKGLQARSDFEVVVQRPNQVVGSSTNADGVRRMIFDGETFTLFDGEKNAYATVLMTASLDALPAQLATTYGFVPPLADFVISNSYRDIKRRAASVRYVGSGPCGTPAVECDRLALSGQIADSELRTRRMTASVRGRSAQ